MYGAAETGRERQCSADEPWPGHESLQVSGEQKNHARKEGKPRATKGQSGEAPQIALNNCRNGWTKPWPRSTASICTKRSGAARKLLSISTESC